MHSPCILYGYCVVSWYNTHFLTRSSFVGCCCFHLYFPFSQVFYLLTVPVLGTHCCVCTHLPFVLWIGVIVIVSAGVSGLFLVKFCSFETELI